MECSRSKRANYADLRVAWVSVTCVECGVEFEITARSHITKRIVRCSNECAAIGRKGRPKSEEHKRRIGEANRGRAPYAWSDEQRAARAELNRQHSHYPGKGLDAQALDDMYRRIAISNSKPKPHLRGPLSPFWKGGPRIPRELIRNRFEYRQWRTAVFERDDYTCQWCGVRGGYLEADHIKPFAYFPELHFELSNGRTLCRPCHQKTDTWGTKARLKYESDYPHPKEQVKWSRPL